MKQIVSRRQRGQAVVEYGVLTAAIAAALFLPLLPGPFGGRTSVFFLFVDVFAIYVRSFHTVIALPMP